MGDQVITGIERAPLIGKIETMSPPARIEEVGETNGNGKSSSSSGVLTTEKLLGALTRSLQRRAQNINQVFSIEEYLKMLNDKPALYLRPSLSNFKEYVREKYGGKKVRVLGRDVIDYRFTDPSQTQLRSINHFRGHPLFVDTFLEYLDNFSKMPYPDKGIAILGPGSTGKSCFVDDLLRILEAYSHSDKGILTTFQWVFPSRLFNYGFGQNGAINEPLKQDEIILTIPAAKNEMPIFLFDVEERKELIDLFIKEGKLPEDFNRDFVLMGKLDAMSDEKILNGLLKVYDKDLTKVLRHVQVVRWYFSSNGGKGSVMKYPTLAPNTFLRPITPEINWDALPPQILNALSSEGLFSQEGLLPKANHGIFYIDDMFRGIEKHKGLNDYLYLLRLAEKGDANVSDPSGTVCINGNYNIVNIGTVNDSRIREVRELDPENWDAISGRMLFPIVEHERCYRYVEELFNDKLRIMLPLESNRHVSPNVIYAFSLWVTMTHLFPYGNTPYYDNLPIDQKTKDRLKQLYNKMTLFEKAKYYQGENLEEYKLDSSTCKYGAEDQKMLYENGHYAPDEYNLGFGENHLEIYEGCVGLPTRVAEVMLRQAIKLKPDDAVTVLELFKVIEGACKREFAFEKKRNKLIADIQKSYQEQSKGKATGGKDPSYSLYALSSPPTTKDLLNQVEEHIKEKIRFDVCKATGFWKTKAEAKIDLEKYIAHMKAWNQKETVAPKYREPKSSDKPNEILLRKNEEIFGVYERYVENKEVKYAYNETKAIEFRGARMRDIASWLISNPDKNMYENLDQIRGIGELIQKLEAAYVRANQKGINNFVEDLTTYIDSERNISKIDAAERRDILLKGIAALEEKGYNFESIIKEVDFAFRSNTSNDYIL